MLRRSRFGLRSGLVTLGVAGAIVALMTPSDHAAQQALTLDADKPVAPSRTLLADEASAITAGLFTSALNATSIRMHRAVRVASLEPMPAGQLASQPSASPFLSATPQPLASQPAVPEPNFDALFARVGNTALNVRSGPSTGTSKVFVLKPGQEVRIAEKDGDWAKVIDMTGQSGWVFSKYLTDVGDTPESPAINPREMTAYVDEPSMQPEALGDAQPKKPKKPKKTADIADEPEKRTPARKGDQLAGKSALIGGDIVVRASPSRSSEALMRIPAGTKVAINETRGNWLHISVGGRSGWIRYR